MQMEMQTERAENAIENGGKKISYIVIVAIKAK